MIKEPKPITPNECAKLIKKKFKLDDIIIVFNDQPYPPYKEGWATDTAEYIIKNLKNKEVFPNPKEKFHFVVGLVKIDTEAIEV